MEIVCYRCLLPPDRLPLHFFPFLFWPPSFQGWCVKGKRPALLPSPFYTSEAPSHPSLPFLFWRLCANWHRALRHTHSPVTCQCCQLMWKVTCPILPTFLCEIPQQPSGHSSGAQCHVRRTELVFHHCAGFGVKHCQLLSQWKEL